MASMPTTASPTSVCANTSHFGGDIDKSLRDPTTPMLPISFPTPAPAPNTNVEWREAYSLKESGNDLLINKDYEGAIEVYTTAIRLVLNPNDGDDEDDIANKLMAMQLDQQQPSLLSILLSNRSFAYLTLGHVDKALEDAEYCVEFQPTWPKGYMRRAKAFEKKGTEYRRDAIDSCDKGF